MPQTTHTKGNSRQSCTTNAVNALMPRRGRGRDRASIPSETAGFRPPVHRNWRPKLVSGLTADDGASVVSEVLRLKPDVVVADITMPKKTGIDALRELAKSGSTSKFIFLTVHSREEYVAACLEEGAAGFVSKSQMKAHLIRAIYAVLDGVRYIATSPPV